MAAERPNVPRLSAHRRPVYLAVALAFVALVATACMPPAPTPAAAPATSSGPAAASINTCPLANGTFTYGEGFGAQPDGSFHQGVDLAATILTPVYAVRNGTLWYYTFYPDGTSDVGGYSVYLKADDGNTYYYTHLTAYAPALENTQVPVVAGQVIGSVNHTGNANGFDHLHFQVRLGGPNGTRVDPRPVLDAAGCTPR